MKALLVLLALLSGVVFAPASAGAAGDKGGMLRGQRLYRENCVACHGWDGKGQRGIFPALAGNPVLAEANAPIRAVLEGLPAAATKAPTQPAMPSFAWKLDDSQVADILTYVGSAWGNRGHPVKANDVARVRAALKRGP